MFGFSMEVNKIKPPLNTKDEFKSRTSTYQLTFWHFDIAYIICMLNFSVIIIFPLFFLALFLTSNELLLWIVYICISTLYFCMMIVIAFIEAISRDKYYDCCGKWIIVPTNYHFFEHVAYFLFERLLILL